MKIQSRLKGAAAPIALSIALLSQPAFAQDEGDDTAPASTVTADQLQNTQVETEDEGDAIVVTGSRIRRSAFNSPDPITIVSPEIAKAQGQFSTAQMLQSSPIAAGSAQVTSAISAVFNTNGGLGSETISLRGLGANRTLVLLNGRRAGPSGTKGAVSSFDLNALPQSIVADIEILKTGASSIYGSDAVAGVVNIITKKDTDGIELDGFISQPTKSGGQDYRLSGTWGKDFGNGHIMATVDFNKQGMLRRHDRNYLDCPQEYIFQGVDTGRILPNGDTDYDSNGQRADIIDPRTGAPRCDDFLWGHVWTYDYEFNQSGLYQYDYDGTLAQYLGVNNSFDPVTGSTLQVPAGFFRVTDEQGNYTLPATGPDGNAYKRLALGLINAYHPFQSNQSVIPETKTYTAYVDASYDVSDNLTIGTELLYNKRKTYYDSYAQFYYLTGYTSDFTPVAPGYGDPFSPGWTGSFFLSPTAITDHNDSSVDIDYYRGVVWADGKFGDFLPNWTYNAYLQYSKSKGSYTDDIIYNDAVDAANLRTGSCAGQTFSGGRQCVDIDWTQPDFLAGDLSPEEEAFLYGEDTGHTTFDEMIGEVSVTGPLFKLPAGDVQIAVGVDGRWDKINDTPGELTLSGNVWPGSGADITAGKSQTLEAFGEIEIPIIHDTPLIKAFTLSGSGRVTNVKATRSDGVTDSNNGNWTYSFGASWEVTDWLQFRARYGTSFRYPALYELFLSNQVGSLSQRQIDPCIQLDANPTVNDRVRANCEAGIPGKLPGVPGDHPGGGVEATVITGGGLGVLDPETSTAKTASVIFRPRISNSTKLNVALDYYDIKIKGEVATLGAANIIYGCYNSEVFPNEPLCDLFTRLDASASGKFNIDTVHSSFLNVNEQRSKGLDVTVDVTQDLGNFGEIQLLAQMNWQFKDVTELFDGNPQDDNGEVGEPKFVGDFNLMWRPNEDWQFFWGVDVIGKSSTEQDYIDVFGDTCNLLDTYGPICVDVTTPTTFYHSVSITRNFKNFKITGGVANLFNTRPPRVTVDGGNNMNGGVIPTVGQSPLVSQYDYYGIRGFLNLQAKF